jgi:glucokinase
MINGLVADVGGTNTRLGRVGPGGLIPDSVSKRPNGAFESFTHLALDYLKARGEPAPSRVVMAVAGPVAGKVARLTNRDWTIEADALAADLGGARATFLNDLEALGHAVPGLAGSDIEALHAGAELPRTGQALVVGLGTGFNVAPVLIDDGAVMASEMGHAALPQSVVAYLATRLPDVSAFETVEHIFSGVGMLRLGRAMGLPYDSAEAIAESHDDRAREAVDICARAFGLMVRELAYAYFPRAGFFFNGSLARTLLAPERRADVLAPLRADDRFDGQFARLPAFLLTSDTVALGGCAAHLMADPE